jgi:hypothetical protein
VALSSSVSKCDSHRACRNQKPSRSVVGHKPCSKTHSRPEQAVEHSEILFLEMVTEFWNRCDRVVISRPDARRRQLYAQC